MFSDKTKSYFISESKDEFLKTFGKRNQLIKKFSFGEVIFLKKEDSLHAVKNKCPHQGASLKGCSVKDGKVICPVHNYGFDLETGRGSGLYLPIYELEENQDGFFLKRTYFSWFGE